MCALGVCAAGVLFLQSCVRQKPVDLLTQQTTLSPAAMPHDNPTHRATPARPRPGTVRDRTRQYGPTVRDCLRPFFHRAGVSYPPARVLLLGIKGEQSLHVYVADRGGPYRFLRSYPILGASGVLGPKQREGDLQVPEGVYRIESLNPNSSYHLALRVNYPNDFDRAMAARDRRTHLGGDIMIHGGSASIGCLAMGDEAAEDLFVLAAETGLPNIAVILTPVDFRVTPTPEDVPRQPAWVPQLYARIRAAMQSLPLPH